VHQQCYAHRLVPLVPPDEWLCDECEHYRRPGAPADKRGAKCLLCAQPSSGRPGGGRWSSYPMATCAAPGWPHKAGLIHVQVRDRGLLMTSARFTYDGGHFSAVRSPRARGVPAEDGA
jgi:hypothetical protein